MENETKRLFRTLGHISTIGLVMALCIGIGAATGHWLDTKFGTEPVLLIIFLIIGMVAAFKNLYTMYKKIQEP